ncbi:hypothetical protein BGZ61DRAFT_502080 [Ilyonectria robusta]|uniref:uncharacterized protein n=1 Tax=Ilyonectria robusta TaxID=1079257 RepID=UPI001E8D1A12|nr:uncharacterized protein BGZ61DRAFT_502080 [Ilyonectria robusta]KAH8738092.1 hypothetical protein BGZ61DRAFT_502080 [Ilyonectria robusta]
MAPPPFPCASIELDYPLYALDFDQEDSNHLVVGGGGGAGRSGVGNKITILETASQHELRVAGEIDLSRDEDSVMSLAMGPRKGKTSHIYAGVNSSHESIAKGKNEHLRALGIEQSKARASAGTKTADSKITELSRTALFTDPDADTYQRLLRIAGPMGAAATAMGKQPQLAVFETAGAAAKLKGILELPREAEDLDIVQTGDNSFQVAFCHKYELHVMGIGKEESEPRMVFTIPDDDAQRPVFRSIRYLSPNFVLAAANLPKRSGVVLFGFRLPTKANDNARLAVTARIPKKVSATALAVSNLSPPASPTAPVGQTQFVVAVAGHDSSISLYTLEHRTSGSVDLLTNLWPFHTLKDVHGNDNITGVAFSTFVAPQTHIRQQFIKLASISLQKTVAVHSIPLRKHIDKATKNKNGPPRPVRYVVDMKSRGPSSRGLIITLSVFALIIAIVGQGMLEVLVGRPPIIHAHKFLPSWYGTLRTPKHQPDFFLSQEFLSKLGGGDIKTQAGEMFVVYEGSETAPATGENGAEDSVKIQLDVHDSAVHGPGKTWDDLGAEQKEAWKARLKDAGAWTQHMGENVFKGILFGELAGAVGRAVAG